MKDAAMRSPAWWADELRQRLWREHSMPLVVAEAIEVEALKVLRECLGELLATAQRDSDRGKLDALALIREARGENLLDGKATGV